VEVIDYLQKLIHQKSSYDFLNMASQGDYHNPVRFLALVRESMLNAFDRELRDCLSIVDDRSYEDYICRYIENINAVIKNEKVKNHITGKFEEVDQFFIQEFEKSIGLNEKPEVFRSQLISKLGAYYLDNPGAEISYKVIFPELVDRLKESFRKEQQKVLVVISKNLVFFEAEKAKENENGTDTPLSEENRQLIAGVMNNLTTKYGYTAGGALSLVKCLLNERY
jgi:predicted Ser/Thr protein kinase